MPSPGWTGTHEWVNYIPFDQLPTAFNPPAGYIVTANNAVVDDDYRYFLSADWAPGYRARRIVEMIDGLESIKLCTGYQYDGATLELPPLGADAIEQCQPIYEEMPGWSQSTVGIQRYEELPENARRYLKRLEEITETSIDIVSTGPDRKETIILRHPFD